MPPEVPAGKGGGAPFRARVAVLGLGNPVLSDDSVGLRVADAVCDLLRDAPVEGVEVLRGTRGGFELLDLLQDYRAAIVVDSYESPENLPGRVRHLDVASLAGSPRLCGVHGVDLPSALAFGSLLGLPMPRHVEVFAVEIADARTIAEVLHPRVEAAVGPLALRIVELARRMAATPDTAAPAASSAQL